MARLFTHFVVERNHTTGFTMDTCEKCGESAAVGCITVHETPERLRKLGFKQVSHIPSELYYDDDSDLCTCGC